MPTTLSRSQSKSLDRSQWDFRFGYTVLILVVLGATMVWLRNRDILSDLYDYSSMITAAGKIEAGLKPYTDFRSTMQSACYVLPALVENIFGHNYLGLTWGGLVLSLGGALVLFALLRPSFGVFTAAMLTGAMTLAGFAQHVVVFYNPLGILCLALVIFGLAKPPPLSGWRIGLVVAALIIGGANKINFQALTIGLGGILILRAGVAREITWKQVSGWWASLLGFGLIVPIGLELWWTGATPADWYFNVIGLAEARVGFVSQIFSLKSYLEPTYTLHQHVLIQPLHTIGLGVLLGVSSLAWRQISVKSTTATDPRRILLLRATLVLLAGAVGIGGVLLTITNIEIITLTSLGVLVGTVAIAISFEIAGRKSIQLILSAAALLWIIVGGYAAWTGSRVLYAREGIDRVPFVRLVNPPPSLKYLEGVRLDADLRNSLLLTAKELSRIKKKQGDLSSVLFGPTLEWLERAHPESILKGMPVWYDLGTSLQTTDGPWLISSLENKQIDRIFVHPDWESWPEDFHTWLQTNFRAIPLGKVVKLYERRNLLTNEAPKTFADQNALAMLDRTGSQIHVRTTRVPVEPPPSFMTSPWGDFFGATGGWTWWWDRPSRIVEGVFVAVAQSGLKSSASISWRIIASSQGEAEVLLSQKVKLSETQSESRIPFRVEPNGQPLTFEIEVEEGASSSIATGWRNVRILHVGDTSDDVPPPGLNIHAPAHKIIAPDGVVSWLRVKNDQFQDHAYTTAFEVWKQGSETGGNWQATLNIEPHSESPGATPVIMLIWCKSSRLEILQQAVPPTESGTFTVGAAMPEPGGWVGVVVRPIEQGKPLNSKIRLLRWSE